MSSVFINYRTGDEEGCATLIERELSRRFGSDKVFRASKSIRPGDNYEHELLEAVRRSGSLVAVMGLRWLTAEDEHGRLIDRETDWTRREILEAFACGIRVIPVLIGSTPRLATSDLPAPLASLASNQYLRLDLRNVDAGLARLADELAELIPDLDDGKGNSSFSASFPGADAGSPTPHVGSGNFFYGPTTAGTVVGRDYYADPQARNQ